MANKFSLSLPKKETLPSTITAEGSVFSIRADYWNILRIFRMLYDPEIMEEHKPILLCKWFYTDEQPHDGVKYFNDFVSMGHESQGSGEDDFDFEADAAEIYSAFMSEYGIDLIEHREMHWYKFKALLDGVFRTSNALTEKIKLRTLDTSKCENKAEAEAAKRSVQIIRGRSRTEESLNRDLEEALRTGVGIAEALERIKNDGRNT